MARLPSLTRSPRKPVTGTTYESQQQVPIPPGIYTETGSSRLSQIADPVPELANRATAVRTYKKMMRSDVSVRSSMRAGKASVLGAEFYVDAYDESEEASIAAEFADFNIFHAPSVPWTKTLEDILRFFENGFSIVEPVFELREWAPKKTAPAANLKKYTMLKKLAARPATTIGQFVYDDNGGVMSVTQNAIDGKNRAKEVVIPIEKLIIFTFEGDGNVEGESILRSCYRNWYYKDKLYTIDAIQKERHGIGVPDIEIQPGASKKETNLAHELGANLRTNEKAYIVRTPMMQVGFAELSGNLVNALESAVHHDNQIMKNILVQFINMGIEGGGGGRATGSTAFDMFMKAMRYVAQMICDYLNLYLIPQLHAYNFLTTKVPKLMVRNIGEVKDFQMWSAGIRNLMTSNGITPDMSTEQFLRKVADMPAKDEPRPEYTDIAQTVERINVNADSTGGPGIGPPAKAAPGQTPPGKPNAPGGSTSKNGGAGNVPKGNTP
jgi:hypothetical protein